MSYLRSPIGTDMYEDSWFQLEGAAWRPFRHPIDAVRHGFNFMQYKLRQFQVSIDKGRVDARAVLKPAQSSYLLALQNGYMVASIARAT